MLKRLTVRNLALVEHLGVDFEPGLNVITGETGAGKSIFIGALGLLLGERADKTLIRSGEDACAVEAAFDVGTAPGVADLLAELSLPPCEEDLLAIRRVVRESGGQNLVNDAPVTLQVLRRLGDLLVDMHGPHDHQSLFRPEAQLDILDAFGGAGPARAAFRAAFDRHAALEAEREALAREDGADVAERIEMLDYRCREIEDAALKEGEEAQLEAEHLRVGNAQRILELAGALAAALTDDEGSAFTALAAAQRPLEELERLLPEAAAWRSEVTDLARRVQELGLAVSGTAERIEADPARLAWLDERLAIYRRLHRKYGGDTAAVLATLEEARARLESLRGRGERLAALDTEIQAAAAAMQTAGEALRRKRTKAADALAEAVTGELEFLGFPRSAFAVDLAPCAPRPSGIDAVEFGFAPNVGEAMRPLRAIASSGEISRAMLAIKAVLAQHDRVPVLVFDEIDANLGGELGHAVGRELSGVAGNRQVLCITHLPQVAVHGATHFVVTKEVRDGRTLSRIERLAPGDERAREVARMLGGDTAAALAHAREMLARPVRDAG